MTARICVALTIGLACSRAADIRTIAGTGKPGHSGDGGPAAAAELNNPYGMTLGPDGALYICEVDSNVVRRMDLKTGRLSTVAGNGQKGYSGDGGPAIEASLNQPYEILFDPAGNMYFAEMPNHVVRRVDGKTGIISTLAGTGMPGFSGDGGPAAQAQLRQPHSIALDPRGEALYIADIGNRRIRRVDLKTGLIATFAGTGESKPTPDGAPLDGTPLNGPRAMAFDARGDMYLVLREGNAVYRIDMRGRTIHHIAGTGANGYTGDGGPAVEAKLSGPKGIAIAPDGGVYIADTESHTIRRIDPNSRIIETMVGDGTRGDGPDGAARFCRLARPHGILIDRAGVIYVADSENHRIRVLKVEQRVASPAGGLHPTCCVALRRQVSRRSDFEYFPAWASDCSECATGEDYAKRSLDWAGGGAGGADPGQRRGQAAAHAADPARARPVHQVRQRRGLRHLSPDGRRGNRDRPGPDHDGIAGYTACHRLDDAYDHDELRAVLQDRGRHVPGNAQVQDGGGHRSLGSEPDASGAAARAEQADRFGRAGLGLEASAGVGGVYAARAGGPDRIPALGGDGVAEGSQSERGG